MSTRAELKQKAKDLLDGKKGKAALIVLVYSLIIFLPIFIPIVGPLVDAILLPVLTYGLLKTFICLKNGEEVGVFDFFSKGCKDFGKVWGVSIRVVFKLLPPLLLVIVPYIGIFDWFFWALSRGVTGDFYEIIDITELSIILISQLEHLMYCDFTIYSTALLLKIK